MVTKRALILTTGFMLLILGSGCSAYVLTDAKKTGNESKAAQLIDKIRVAEAQYASRNRGRFADFDELRKSLGWVIPDLGKNPVADGYVFKLTITEPSEGKPAQFTINADPEISSGISATGSRHFYNDSTLATIKVTEEDRPATANDPTFQGL